MKKALAFLILSLTIPAIAGAQEVASLEEMRQAAEKGNAEAQMEVGILYEFGYNMPKNAVSALAWYMRAADRGSVLAVKRRDLLKSHMTAQEIDEAQKQANAPLTAVPAPASTTPPAATAAEEKPAPSP